MLIKFFRPEMKIALIMSFDEKMTFTFQFPFYVVWT